MEFEGDQKASMNAINELMLTLVLQNCTFTIYQSVNPCKK